MIRFGKKAIAIALVAMMTLTAFAGCGKKEAAKLDEKAVFMTVGDTKVSTGVAHFYIRYQQALMETVFGTAANKWQVQMETGVSREEAIKDAIVEQLQELYIIAEHAKDYKVELTDIELEYIESSADEFVKENSKDAQKKTSATKENVMEYMKVSMIVMKTKGAMKKDIDTKVDVEDAKQKRISYMAFPKVETDAQGNETKLSDKKVKEQKKAAEDFFAKAKANGNLNKYATDEKLSVKTLTFDASTTTPDKDFIKKVDALKENEFSGVIDTDSAYYVAQLESLYDEDATDKKMESILEERGEARYKELLEKWKKDTKIKVDEDILKKISFQDLEVVYKEDEKKDDKKEDSTESKDSKDTTKTEE